MNSKTKTVLAGTSTDKVALIFENEDVNAIPIVNKENIIQGCYFRSNFNKNYKRASECLIMAGGFGKRMGHLTKIFPNQC